MSSDKLDKGKDRWDLLPIVEIEQVVRVLSFGTAKYEDNGWQGVVKDNPDRYYAAALRHLVARRKGEIFDSETKLPHLAHGICDLIFLLWADNNS